MDRQRGVALFTVVWLSLIVMILTLGVIRETRIAAGVARNSVDHARLAAAAEAGLVWTELALTARRAGAPLPADGSGSSPRITEGPLPLDGRSRAWTFGDTRITVSIQAERGKLDLLAAEQALIEPLLAQLGIPKANEIAATVLPMRRTAGGVRSISWRLGGRALSDLGELAGRLGLDASELERLRSVATVHGHLPSPDPLVAPPEIFAALLLGEDRRASLVAARSTGSVPVAPGETEVFTVEILASNGSGGSARLAALVEVGSDGLRRLRITR